VTYGGTRCTKCAAFPHSSAGRLRVRTKQNAAV